MTTIEGTLFGVSCENATERFASMINNKLLSCKTAGKAIISISWSDLALITENDTVDWSWIETQPELINAFKEVIEIYKTLYRVEKVGQGGRLYRFYIE